MQKVAAEISIAKAMILLINTCHMRMAPHVACPVHSQADPRGIACL